MPVLQSRSTGLAEPLSSPTMQNTAALLLRSFGVRYSPWFCYLNAGAGSLYEELWEKIS